MIDIQKIDIQKKIRILHVDDEVDTLVVVKKILELEGYEVVSINHAKAALEHIRMNGFDLIILDIMMPDMSGWELFSHIGAIKPNYKVAFLSILDIAPENLDVMLKAGIKAYIKKPFDNSNFVNQINKIINTK